MTGRSLGQLTAVVDSVLIGDPSVIVNDVTHDSRQVGPGTLFVAVRGTTTDGHDFVDRATESGAVAVCVEKPTTFEVPQLVVPDTRKAMGPLAAEVHDNPSSHLKLVGVTGTNGKTTVTHYIESITTGAGIKCGLIGTIQTRAAGQVFSSERTTPESSDFQRLLGAMRDLGCGVVAAEVSSHALALDRVAATHFEVAAFTNLSQDHLDFHGDMKSYLEAKRSLFHDYPVGTSVVNIDDSAGEGLAAGVSGSLVTVGSGGDAFVDTVRPTPGGTAFRLVTPWGSADVEAPVIGSFNLDNAVMAAVCSLATGIGFDYVVSGLTTLGGVPGRFEMISDDDPVTVIVDYAHTPEGVRLAVESARRLNPGRLIALVGAGGDRDRDKRPLMGEAVSGADLAVITSDNPRSEDPLEIIEAVTAGVTSELVVEPDRRAAIRMALAAADPGDLVLLLGRGHEPFQEIAGKYLPFDDREVARVELVGLRSATKSDRGDMRIAP